MASHWPMASWFELLFDDRYLRFYPELFDFDEPERDVAFLSHILTLPPASQLLDLGCGFGRHAVAFAKCGYRVTGVDLSVPMLNAGAKLAAERGAAVEWYRRDLRDLSGLGPFGGCVSLYTGFGYFDDDTNERVLDGVCSILDPGAPLVLDVTNALPLVPRLPLESWREGPFGLRLERVQYDGLSGRVLTDRVLIGKNGEKEELPQSSIRLYTASELRRLLERSGFTVEAAYGALANRPFVPHRSQRIVLLARKPMRGRASAQPR